jgi:Ca2+-binding EF-hand superfamily protein
VNEFKLNKSEHDLREAFECFDKDGDGGMSVAELRDMAHAMGWGMSDTDLHDMISAADTNSDGFVDFREFQRLIFGS